MAVYLRIKRLPYEEPDNTHLFISASNGEFAGTLDIYCSVGDIRKIGEGLRGFPATVGAEFRYENGSEAPEDRYQRYFLFRAFTVNRTGHCALQVIMNRNETGADDAYCRFSLPVEAAALERLGALFRKFGELEHFELDWSPTEGGLR